MVATNCLIKNYNGATMSLFLAAAAAVNTYLPVALTHTALATDVAEFIPTHAVVLKRATFGAAVTGQLIIEENGIDLPYIIDIENHQVDLTIPGGDNLDIALRAGQKYRFKVLTALSA